LQDKFSIPQLDWVFIKLCSIGWKEIQNKIYLSWKKVHVQLLQVSQVQLLVTLLILHLLECKLIHLYLQNKEEIIPMYSMPFIESQKKKVLLLYGQVLVLQLLELLFWILVCWLLMMRSKKDWINIMELKIQCKQDWYLQLVQDFCVRLWVYLLITARQNYKRWKLGQMVNSLMLD